MIIINQGVRLTLKSLYTYLKAYFNYDSSGNYIYARAISEAMGVIREALDKNESIPIQKYLKNTFSLKLTKEIIKTVTYWDLSKESIAEIDYQSLQPVDKQSLIEAANRIE